MSAAGLHLDAAHAVSMLRGCAWGVQESGVQGRHAQHCSSAVINCRHCLGFCIVARVRQAGTSWGGWACVCQQRVHAACCGGILQAVVSHPAPVVRCAHDAHPQMNIGPNESWDAELHSWLLYSSIQFSRCMLSSVHVFIGARC